MSPATFSLVIIWGRDSVFMAIRGVRFSPVRLNGISCTRSCDFAPVPPRNTRLPNTLRAPFLISADTKYGGGGLRVFPLSSFFDFGLSVGFMEKWVGVRSRPV